VSIRRPLGSLLVAEDLITQDQLDAGLAEQVAGGLPLGRILVERGQLAEVDLARILAIQHGLEFVDLAEYPVDRAVIGLVPESVARRFKALPIGWDPEGRLVVAMADPTNVFALDDIHSLTKAEVKAVVVTKDQLLEALDRFHRLDGEAGEVAQIAADELTAADDATQVREAVDEAPIVRFVNLLITQAVADRASDIHVEPAATDLRIRFRVDGVLHQVMRSPRSIQAGVISRLKIMADINITERRLPQDGRMSLTVGAKTIDLRVATLPTVHGEKVVMRILDNSQARLDLTDLGFRADALRRYEASYRKPYGTILVTGPTGSGKSTTLYATLNVLNDEQRNIITVEDPVEYRLEGVNQIQVNPRAGLTFAAALRSILRADPDIILVGEIRDRETAVIAIEAALTGHLVLSTLHTNDAASTPMRLIEMGVEPFLVTSALDCVVAQRLARRLCERCKQAYTPSPAELTEAGWPTAELGASPELFRPVGCPACTRTGYRGRLAIQEVMVLSEEIDRMIIERYSSDDLKKAAIAEGMAPLREDGLLKVAQGITTLEEIFRVVA
jgi:type IV pilus assembly protein PilB